MKYCTNIKNETKYETFVNYETGKQDKQNYQTQYCQISGIINVNMRHSSLFFIESKSKFEQLCSLCCKIKSETAVNVVSPQAMFSTDLIESKQERVAINGVEPQMIGMLVSYAYTSEVYISKANVQVKLPNNPPVPLTPSFPLVFPSLFFQS